MNEFLAQNMAIGTAITLLGVGLGLIAVCIPRIRKKFDVMEGKPAKKKTVRHEAAGSFQQRSKYGVKKR